MKYAILLISLLFVNVALGEQPPDPTNQAYWKSLNMRAYYVTGENGERILVVTNLDQRGRRIGGEVATVRQTLRQVDVELQGATGQSAVARAAGPAKISVERLGSASVGSSRPLLLDAPRGGVPVCLWKGQWVAPVLQGDKLVCPSDSSPFAVTPR